MVQPHWKAFWSFLTKLNIFLPYNTVIAHLGMYSKELNTYVHTKIPGIFIAVIFIIADYK